MPDPLKIIYMGTPEFATGPLQAIITAGFDVAGVVTAPDKPGGRGNKLIVPEVKQFCIENNIHPVLQPENLKDPLFIEQLRNLNADIFVVVAFRMLPRVVWSMPSKGTINLHASLLPQYRGAAPINRVIMNGEKITGVTTFFINEDIDTGRIILQQKVEIPETFTAGELHDVLMTRGSGLLVETVRRIQEGNVKEIPQDDLIDPGEQLRAAPKIFREDCRINWNDDVVKIYDQIRGLSPFPAAYSELISPSCEIIQVKFFNSSYKKHEHDLPPGKIMTEERKRIVIAANGGFLYPELLQQSGRKKMDPASFINGFKDLEKYHFS